MENKEVLIAANKAVTNGNYEEFLSFCSEDTRWTFTGDISLNGKEAVRQWMKENYIEPPVFNVDYFIAENDFVTAIGKITISDAQGQKTAYEYCDVWRFSDGKMVELKAYVIEVK